MTATKVGTTEVWDIDGIRMTNVHPENACLGEHCVLHNPSIHPMNDWKMAAGYVPSDQGLLVMIYRVCEHGVWHNDPDSQAFVESATGDELPESATCDGCCA